MSDAIRCSPLILLLRLSTCPPSSDLPTGNYVQDDPARCSSLCEAGRDCCDVMASCKCGTHTGQYDCVCEKGYYGKGLQHECTGRSHCSSLFLFSFPSRSVFRKSTPHLILLIFAV